MSLRIEVKLVADPLQNQYVDRAQLLHYQALLYLSLKIRLFRKYKNCRRVHENIRIYLVIKVVSHNLNSFLFHI